MVRPIMVSPGNTGIDEPPGITPFSLWPLRTPPAICSSSENGVPRRTSKLPGRLTWPVTEKIFGPPLLGLPRLRNQSAPLRNIAGAEAKVSVLLIVVGRPYQPQQAGNGGLKRGWPFLPSSDSISEVSSPHIYAPAPSALWI